MRRNAKKSKSGRSRNQSSTIPELCFVYYFMDPDDEEFKEIMKNARRKMEIPTPAAMLCKLQREKYRETCRVEEHKTKYACVAGAAESVRKRMEGYPHKNHEDHMCKKRDKFIESQRIGAQIYYCASSNENTRCRCSSGECEKPEEITAWQMTKVRNKK